MTTIRGEVVNTFVATLEAALASTSIEFFHNRDVPMDARTAPYSAVNVMDGGHRLNDDSPTSGNLYLDQYIVVMLCELYAFRKTKDELADALDALYEAVAVPVLALQGGENKIDLIRDGGMEEPIVSTQSGQGPAIQATLAFNVVFSTAQNNPVSQS